MKESIQYAVNHFQDGFSCSQSILMAFGPIFGLPEETASRIASSFGGGIAMSGETSGAVCGSLMVLGLKYGSEGNSDKEVSYQKTATFIDRFKAEHDSIRCKQLISYDISQPEEFQAARESNEREKICTDLVRSAAEMLAALLE
ncbi:C-GCAxxG-C-C family protein [Chloroflexota bacterium]